MNADADLFTDAPAPESSLFTDEPAPKSVGGFAKNAWEDVKGNARGIVDLGEGLLTHPIDTVKAVPGALLKEGERLGGKELLTGHPINAAEKFGNAVYDKPLSTGLDVAALFGVGKGGANLLRGAGEVGEEAAATAGRAAEEGAAAAEKGAPAAEGAVRVAPGTPEPIKLPPEAGEAIKPGPPPPPEPAPAPAAPPATEQLAGKVMQGANDAMAKGNEVKDYINRGWQGFTKKPGAIANVADYVQEKSQMMAAQQMGFTPLQARQLGHEGMRAIGQYGLDSGIVSPTTGLEGMRKLNSQLLEKAGSAIDKYRTMADKAGQGYQPGELLKTVKAQLDKKYLRGVTPESPAARGVHGMEAGGYQKALQEVEDAAEKHSDAAEISTTLNHAANEANRLNQPHGAFTDVANTVSHINNERIKTLIGPENAAKYEQALKEFGVNKKIAEGLKRKAAGEVKRFGPGSVTSNLTQKMMDEVGYRAGAKVANKVSTSILKNPSIAKSLPSLFKEFINQVEETSHEVTGLSEGGMVTPDMAQFVGTR